MKAATPSPVHISSRSSMAGGRRSSPSTARGGARGSAWSPWNKRDKVSFIPHRCQKGRGYICSARRSFLRNVVLTGCSRAVLSSRGLWGTFGDDFLHSHPRRLVIEKRSFLLSPWRL